MKEILLTKGKVGYISDEDFYLVENKKCHSVVCDGLFYVRLFSAPKTKSYLHRYILESRGFNLSNKIVDHKDGNGLNNQYDNLRICDSSQNGMNKKKITGQSKYKGVVIHSSGKWYSRIKLNKKYICIGVFDKEEDAGIAYDIFAVKLFQDFAVLNFPFIDIDKQNNVLSILKSKKSYKYL